MRLELLQYLFTLRYYKNSVPCAKGFTENENKIIAYLQFGDWYHLNTRWLTQKKKRIMSYAPDRKKEAGVFEKTTGHTRLSLQVLLDNYRVLFNKHLLKNPFI